MESPASMKKFQSKYAKYDGFFNLTMTHRSSVNCSTGISGCSFKWCFNEICGSSFVRGYMSDLHIEEIAAAQITPISFKNINALSVCFRRDSDIFNFYGYAPRELLNQEKYAGFLSIEQYVENLIAKKSKLAIWIVSNCKRTAGAKLRMAYVDELVKAGLDLDRRGNCFPQNGYVDKEEIINYKFYLAFENSWHCKDYITEKVFKNALGIGGAVPVVFGAKKSDYEALVPPGSCIYAEDFKSPKLLVDYLNYLDKNETAYRGYMKWRTMGKDEMPMSEITTDFCQLCRVLHGINIDNIYNRKFSELQSYIPLFGYPNKSRVVPSLTDWFYGQDFTECMPKL